MLGVQAGCLEGLPVTELTGTPSKHSGSYIPACNLEIMTKISYLLRKSGVVGGLQEGVCCSLCNMHIEPGKTIVTVPAGSICRWF